MHKIFIVLFSVFFIMFIGIGNAAANSNDCTLHQINSTHWYFETEQIDLAYGMYFYQAFGNNISSDYMILEYSSVPSPTPTATATATPIPDEDTGRSSIATDSDVITIGNETTAKLVLGVSDRILRAQDWIQELIGSMGRERPPESNIFWGIVILFGLGMFLDGGTYRLDKKRLTTIMPLNSILLIIIGMALILSGLIWTGLIAIT